MIHDDFDDWAAAALTDGLSPAERAEFHSHLAACAQCRALYQHTEAMNQTLTNAFDLERPAPNFENKLVAAFREGERKSWLSQVPATIAWVLRLRGVQTAGVLAALTLLVAVGNQLTQSPFTPVHTRGGSRTMIISNSPTAFADTSESLKTRTAAAPTAAFAHSWGSLAAKDKAIAESNKDVAGGAVDALGLDGDKGALSKESDGFDKSKLALNQPVRSQPVDDERRDKQFAQKSLENSLASADAPAPQMQPPVDPTASPVDARKLIRNASVELEVASFDTALDKLATAATQAGGYVATKNSARGGNGKLRGTIVIKVLPQHLDGFLLDLRTIGEVKNQTLATQDVTKEYTDTAAHLRNAQRMEDRLLKMLEEAKGRISEILQVEKELGRVRESIETMQGELKLYDSLVSYATVTLSLAEKDLNQPAAFLLRQNGNLDLLAADVEKTYAEARRIAESVQAQISHADVSRDSNGRVNASMQLLIPAPAADSALTRLKALGRIQNFTSQTQRTAQNGSNGDAGMENAKVENAPASIRLSIQHDEQTHRQIRFTVFARDLDQAFDAAKKSALESGAEVVNSNLNRPRDGGGSATLVLRVPAQKHAELVATLQKLGRASDYQVQRDAASDDDASPVLVSLSLTDEEPSVQQTRLSLQSSDIETRLQTFKKEAIAAGATVRDSGYQRQPDGRETAQIVLRFPLNKYASLLAQAQALGKTQELSVQRRDSTATPLVENSAPAELTVSLATESGIVAADTGLLATLRHTLSQAIRSLLWSVQMIGVALAFLAPWAIGVAVIWLVISRLRRRKH
ncbi:MAG: DUF4349 domain-containing protein [Chthoniobacterales bacterium]